MTAVDIEHAVVILLDYRRYVIVPNVSYGLFLNHECDLLALDKSDRFTEIEIKISKSDLKRDFDKEHNHKSKYISRLIYAVPESILEYAISIIPKTNGIISVNWKKNESLTSFNIPVAKWVRRIGYDKTKPVVDTRILNMFMRLGCMRIWTLKSHYYNYRYRQKT